MAARRRSSTPRRWRGCSRASRTRRRRSRPTRRQRLPVTSRIVVQNRTAPPNVIVDTVEQRSGDRRFDKLEDIISKDELRAIFERYQKVAGYHVQQVGRSQG